MTCDSPRLANFEPSPPSPGGRLATAKHWSKPGLAAQPGSSPLGDSSRCEPEPETLEANLAEVTRKLSSDSGRLRTASERRTDSPGLGSESLRTPRPARHRLPHMSARTLNCRLAL